MTTPQYLPNSSDGHLDIFYTGTPMNNNAMDTIVYIFWWIHVSISVGLQLNVEFLSYVVYVQSILVNKFVFLEKVFRKWFSKADYQNLTFVICTFPNFKRYIKQKYVKVLYLILYKIDRTKSLSLYSTHFYLNSFYCIPKVCQVFSIWRPSG